MTRRDSGQAAYTEADKVIDKLSHYIADGDWISFLSGLGTIHIYWAKASSWEKIIRNAEAATSLPGGMSKLPTLAQRLAAIVAPNVENIRSHVLEADENNLKFFAWLDEVLAAAGSPQAGQFMAPILVKQRQEAISNAAQAFADALDFSGLPPSVANQLLLEAEAMLRPGQGPMSMTNMETRLKCLRQRLGTLRASLLAWQSLPQAEDD